MSLLLASLSVELVLDIASFADTRSLSALARTCRTLHNLLNPMLEKAFTADLEDIAVWAIGAHNPLIFSRVMTAALAPSALAPLALLTKAFIIDYAMIYCDEPIPCTTRQDAIYMYVEQLLLLQILRLEPVHHDGVKILKLALSHGVSPVSLQWWCIDMRNLMPWLIYAVRHGDLELLRWLLVEAGAEVETDVMVEDGQTLLNFALYRRFDRPRNEHVEEVFQLLVEHCSRPHSPYGEAGEPGVFGGDA